MQRQTIYSLEIAHRTKTDFKKTVCLCRIRRKKKLFKADLKQNFVMISIYISCVVCFTHAFLQVENSCFPSDPGTSPTHHHTTWMQKSFSVQFLRNSKSSPSQIILHVHNEMRSALGHARQQAAAAALPESRNNVRLQKEAFTAKCINSRLSESSAFNCQVTSRARREAISLQPKLRLLLSTPNERAQCRTLRKLF